MSLHLGQKKKILFDCPTDSEFENLKKRFLFIIFFSIYYTKEYWPCFWKLLKKVFFFFFFFFNFDIFAFWNVKKIVF